MKRIMILFFMVSCFAVNGQEKHPYVYGKNNTNAYMRVRGFTSYPHYIRGYIFNPSDVPANQFDTQLIPENYKSVALDVFFEKTVDGTFYMTANDIPAGKYSFAFNYFLENGQFMFGKVRTLDYSNANNSIYIDINKGYE